MKKNLLISVLVAGLSHNAVASDIEELEEKKFFFFMRHKAKGLVYKSCRRQEGGSRFCSPITRKDLRNLPSSLVTLDLSKSEDITDQDIESFPRSLKKLNLAGCHITDNGLAAYLSQNTNLTHLILGKCNITGEDESQTAYLSRSISLTFLGLALCENITDKSLQNLPQGLKKLNLIGCPLTEESLQNLPASLTFLDLSFCENITDKSLQNLPASLTFLNLTGCIITEEKVASLIKKGIVVKTW